jgi:DNA-binding NarL/FixJ family response regulator
MGELQKGIEQINSEQEEVIKEIDRLSDREKEVLDLFARGISTNDIAERLKLDPKTIESHRQRFLRKLGFKYEREAVALWNKYKEATKYE